MKLGLLIHLPVLVCYHMIFTLCNMSCEGTDCGPPPNISNGMQTVTSTKVNGIVFYNCNNGYQLDGINNQLTCDDSGKWVVTVPVCKGKNSIV